MSRPRNPRHKGGLPRKRRPPPGQPEPSARPKPASAPKTAVSGASAGGRPSSIPVRRRPPSAPARDTLDEPGDDMREDLACEVGYGKPPKSGQIKKGEVRNPKGRPKKNRADAGSVKRSLKAELAQFIKITEGTKAKKVTQGDVVVKTLIRKAMKGDNPAIRMLFAMLGDEDAQGANNASAVPDEPNLTVADTDILEQFRQQCIEQHLKSRGHSK